MTLPKKDYITARNLGKVRIYIDKDSTLLIFNHAYHDEYSNPVECYLENYKYEHFVSGNNSDSEKK